MREVEALVRCSGCSAWVCDWGLERHIRAEDLSYAAWRCGLCSVGFFSLPEARAHFLGVISRHPHAPLNLLENADQRLEARVLAILRQSRGLPQPDLELIGETAAPPKDNSSQAPAHLKTDPHPELPSEELPSHLAEPDLPTQKLLKSRKVCQRKNKRGPSLPLPRPSSSKTPKPRLQVLFLPDPVDDKVSICPLAPRYKILPQSKSHPASEVLPGGKSSKSPSRQLRSSKVRTEREEGEEVKSGEKVGGRGRRERRAAAITAASVIALGGWEEMPRPTGRKLPKSAAGVRLKAA